MAYGNQRYWMNDALQEIVVPRLREMGFKGSLPYFRRRNGEKYDLLWFSFHRFGYSFVMEISCCPLDGVKTSKGKHIPPNKVKAWEAFDYGYNRICENDLEGRYSREIWFDFESDSGYKVFKNVADRVVQRLPKVEALFAMMFPRQRT